MSCGVAIERGRRAYLLAYLLSGAVLGFDAQRLIRLNIHEGLYGRDFVTNVWQPAIAILHGANPYPAGSFEPTYPPPLLLLGVPFGLLPHAFATIVAQVLLLATAVAVLAVLRIRDWRCYAIWLLSGPCVFDLLLADPNLVVVLAAAAVWRWRDRVGAAVGVGAAFVLKLLLVPVAVWLAATGRRAATLYAALAAPIMLLVAWAAIGFDGLAGYPDRVLASRRAYLDSGLLFSGLASKEGAGTSVAMLVGLATGAACLALALRLRRDAVASFTLAIFATLLASPICWEYYLGLLVVPLAIRQPRLSREWLAFAWLWLTNLLVLPIVLWLVWRLTRPVAFGVARRQRDVPEEGVLIVGVPRTS